MTRSDLVMVEREVLADALAFLESEMHWSQPAPDMGEEPSNQFTYDAIPVAMALREALSSSDPEGGARGVQTSIATKQESCPESAPRTETTVRDWRKSVFTYEHDDAAGHLYYFAPQVTAPGPFLEQRHVQAIVDIASDGTFAGVELIDNMPPLNSGGADTKSDGGVVADTPSDETATEVMAHPSPMGSRSCDEKTIACGVAGVAPGPSDQLTKTTETAFHFHRFVKGQERAEGVMICKALSLQDAFYAARKLYNYPNNMDLVLAISDSEVAILRDIARTSVALSECHKEIAKLREQLLSHSTGEH